MRCRYAPTCRGLCVLNRAQHLIGNKSLRGANSGRTQPTNTMRGARAAMH